MKSLENIIKNAVDLHVHIGPEIIPRKFLLQELITAEQGCIAGIGVKNHFFPTIAMSPTRNKNTAPFIVYSVTLNRSLGGFNSEIIRASAQLSDKPIIVWFPTLCTQSFLSGQRKEIPLEWIDPTFRSSIVLRDANAIQPLTIVTGKNELSPEVVDVLKTIKDNNCILATGHLSPNEIKKLVKYASEQFGITKIIITHPIYQKINMSITDQKKMVALGAVIEHCFSMVSIDNIPVQRIAQQIKQVGARNCILSSDVGQTFTPKPSEALFEFAQLLEHNGISRNELQEMLITNPSRLIS
ncbi:MAG: hypothetical protein A2666_00970 [Parcubacteria group bacterium RIFCSPHIGHO2_01_FULL_47_10b]|nr:MAG: hypothetical protein A2666_00970 [Parcubacteria group bacterium RIFCSPHIGHO2_01_FULL_47_10b]